MNFIKGYKQVRNIFMFLFLTDIAFIKRNSYKLLAMKYNVNRCIDVYIIIRFRRYFT